MSSLFFGPLKSLAALDTAGVQLNEQLQARGKAADERKEEYAAEMAKATDQDAIFKYFLLINLSAIESYVTAARLQSQSSFALCKKVAYLSFLLIALGVGLGLLAWAQGKNLTVAQLTGLVGILTQVISWVFFYLYNQTLDQVNRLSDQLS